MRRTDIQDYVVHCVIKGGHLSIGKRTKKELIAERTLTLQRQNLLVFWSRQMKAKSFEDPGFLAFSHVNFIRKSNIMLYI